MIDKGFIKEVMAYFGDELGCEGEAESVVEIVKKNKGLREGLYFEFMNGIREVLIERGFDVPFRAVYKRRVK